MQIASLQADHFLQAAVCCVLLQYMFSTLGEPHRVPQQVIAGVCRAMQTLGHVSICAVLDEQLGSVLLGHGAR